MYGRTGFSSIVPSQGIASKGCSTTNYGKVYRTFQSRKMSIGGANLSVSGKCRNTYSDVIQNSSISYNQSSHRPMSHPTQREMSFLFQGGKYEEPNTTTGKGNLSRLFSISNQINKFFSNTFGFSSFYPEPSAAFAGEEPSLTLDIDPGVQNELASPLFLTNAAPISREPMNPSIIKTSLKEVERESIEIVNEFTNLSNNEGHVEQLEYAKGRLTDFLKKIPLIYTDAINNKYLKFLDRTIGNEQLFHSDEIKKIQFNINKAVGKALYCLDSLEDALKREDEVDVKLHLKELETLIRELSLEISAQTGDLCTCLDKQSAILDWLTLDKAVLEGERKIENLRADAHLHSIEYTRAFRASDREKVDQEIRQLTPILGEMHLQTEDLVRCQDKQNLIWNKLDESEQVLCKKIRKNWRIDDEDTTINNQRLNMALGLLLVALVGYLFDRSDPADRDAVLSSLDIIAKTNLDSYKNAREEVENHENGWGEAKEKKLAIIHRLEQVYGSDHPKIRDLIKKIEAIDEPVAWEFDNIKKEIDGHINPLEGLKLISHPHSIAINPALRQIMGIAIPSTLLLGPSGVFVYALLDKWLLDPSLTPKQAEKIFGDFVNGYFEKKIVHEPSFIENIAGKIDDIDFIRFGGAELVGQAAEETLEHLLDSILAPSSNLTKKGLSAIFIKVFTISAPSAFIKKQLYSTYSKKELENDISVLESQIRANTQAELISIKDRIKKIEDFYKLLDEEIDILKSELEISEISSRSIKRSRTEDSYLQDPSISSRSILSNTLLIELPDAMSDFLTLFQKFEDPNSNFIKNPNLFFDQLEKINDKGLTRGAYELKSLILSNKMELIDKRDTFIQVVTKLVEQITEEFSEEELSKEIQNIVHELEKILKQT